MSLVPIILLAVLTSAAAGGPDMEEKELFGLFEVMGSLLDDPSWAQMHPFPCTDTPWPGLECELLVHSPTFHVTKIHVGPDVSSPPCKPSARISDSILKLPYLKTLSLISCFTNTKSPVFLPKSLFGPFPFLEHLTLSSNPSLTGKIPSNLSNLKNLRTLCLPENSLTGRIPATIGKLESLQQLDLSRNNLSGPIPVEIGELGNLSILDLSLNFLQGSLPGSMGRLKSIEKIDLGFNGLQGTLPVEFGELKTLTLLDLSRNLLTGQLPDELSGLQKLEYLIMDENPLNATFPNFI
ncbi:leucine-rich repeat receptor-like protein kinase family protein [Striga asiatica]|uniref:Leucine-rich repeat receptor-like protein kinase family protein n=1 Tax=Striga asiatica TaxID=4170 RepID=A0A5A7NVP0_STRAF|nr:leucine-rich repeat receptor-like protein kinase family protein [Striga asiatica]